MEMKKLKYTKLYAKIGLIALCILVLIIIPLLRGGIQLGHDPYLFIRNAKHLSAYDPLSYGGRFNAHFLGIATILSLSPKALSYILPFLIGLISLMLFYQILKENNLHEKKLIVLLLIISPSFIFLFSTLNKFFFSVFLCLLGYWLLMHKNKIYRYLSLLVFLILPIFNSKMAIIMGILLIYSILNKKDKGFILASIIVLFSSTILFNGYIFYNSHSFNFFFDLKKLTFHGRLENLFTDLGSRYGLSIFASILAIFGIIPLWKKKYKNLFLFFSVLTLIIFSFFFSEAIFLINLFIAIFAAKGILYLYQKVWENEVLKKLTIFIFICGLIFSCLSFLNERIKDEPTSQTINALDFLSNKDFGTVFSHYNRGIWINYAGKANIMDTNYLFAPDPKNALNDSQELFMTRDIEKAKNIIDKYKIKYIFLDQDLNHEIWQHDEEGLQFILKYNPNFKKIYNQGGIKIWKIKGLNKKG